MLLHNYINYTKVTTEVSTLKTSKTLMHIFLVFFPPFFNKNKLLCLQGMFSGLQQGPVCYFSRNVNR